MTRGPPVTGLGMQCQLEPVISLYPEQLLLAVLN